MPVTRSTVAEHPEVCSVIHTMLDDASRRAVPSRSSRLQPAADACRFEDPSKREWGARPVNFAKFQELVEERTGFRTMDDAMATRRVLQRLVRRHVHLLPEGRPRRRASRTSRTSRRAAASGRRPAACWWISRAGKTIDEAYAITDAEIEAELDGYPEKKKDYPERSLAALRAAIDDYRAKRAAGAITDAMLERAKATAPPRVAPAEPVAVAEEPAGPRVVDDGGVLTIKLR